MSELKKLQFAINCNSCNECFFIENNVFTIGEIEELLIMQNWSIVYFKSGDVMAKFYLCPKCSNEFMSKHIFNYQIEEIDV